MGRRGQSITLSISDRDKEQLEAFALEFGMTWGDKPNISGLIKAIADRKILIAANHDWTDERINALDRARLNLIDLGKNTDALTIAELLLERAELKIPLRKELDSFVGGQQLASWRVQIDRYIKRQQPFRLSYQDAKEQIWTFTVYFAEIVARDEHEYLDCWCEENNSGDISELQHNWSLRLDRITDAAIVKIDRSWRSGLDTIPVEIYLFGGLARSYQSKKNRDDVNEWLDESMQVKRVVRSISSPFWFKREIFRYGKDCEVISPQRMRDAIVLEIKTMQQRYQDD
ncbi:WYL domain-containing protein [Chamaesiphon sp. VAR_48_metabat_403]|uniref:helix-turn-helix transcriptional regulator n=1 Tax=Chamaesiphon sp. VAR_48_metabat_403 TaxID=2964700 RepID=UPI00286DA55D|nr:WYL domain-containing protein [Chamaesiphon sp. VAR_48_metabat_403]